VDRRICGDFTRCSFRGKYCKKSKGGIAVEPGKASM